jgi:hypothetical protein
VQLVADLGNLLSDNLIGATVVSLAGLAATGIGLAIGVLTVVAAIPATVSLPAGAVVARRQRRRATEAHDALEQVLDRLEHGDLEPHRTVPGARRDPLLRVADEIRGLIAAEREKKR